MAGVTARLPTQSLGSRERGPSRGSTAGAAGQGEAEHHQAQQGGGQRQHPLAPVRGAWRERGHRRWKRRGSGGGGVRTEGAGRGDGD